MKVFICGFGTVGQGFAEVLASKGKMIKDRFGQDVSITGAMDSRTYVCDPAGLDPLALVARKKEKRTVGDKGYTDPAEVLAKADYDVLVEVSPTDVKTGGAGLGNIISALKRGKDVITVNKGPLALKYAELTELAQKNGCMLRFEGSVGGAMPILNLCAENLMGEKIVSIRGIFNGTCNYILSKMDKGQPFDQALKEAQQLGYAETDPTNDIEGYDSACKVAILANAVFGRNVTFNDIKITGITSITEEAVSMAASRNMVIRLIGEVSDSRLEVGPRLIPKGHPLSISGTLNTAQIVTDLAGPVTVSGRGAGRAETASAILSDLMAILERRTKGRDEESLRLRHHAQGRRPDRGRLILMRRQDRHSQEAGRLRSRLHRRGLAGIQPEGRRVLLPRIEAAPVRIEAGGLREHLPPGRSSGRGRGPQGAGRMRIGMVLHIRKDVGLPCQGGLGDRAR